MTPFRRLTIFAGLADVLLLAAAIALYIHFGLVSHLILVILVATILAGRLIGLAVAHTTHREDVGVVIYGFAYSLIIVGPVFLFSDFWWISLLLSVLLIMLPWMSGQTKLAVPLVLLALFSAALMLVFNIWLLEGERAALVQNPWIAALMAVGYMSFSLLPGIFSLARMGEKESGLFSRYMTWFLGVATVAAVAAVGVIVWQMSLRQVDRAGAHYLSMAELQAERAGNLLEEQLNLLQLLWGSTTVVEGINTANADYGFAITNPETVLDLRQRNTEWQAAASDSELVRAYLLNEETQVLVRFLNAHPQYLDLIVTDKLGGLVAATGGKPELFFYGDETWWQAAMDDSDGVHIGNLLRDEQSGVYTVLVAMTVKDPQTVGEGADPGSGQVVGMVISTLDLHQFQLGLQTEPGGFDGQLALLSSDELVLAGSDIEGVQAAWNELSTEELLENLISARALISGALGERVMLAHSPMQTTDGQYLTAFRNLGWQAVAFQSEAQILAGLNDAAQMAALAVIVVLALMVYVSWQASMQVNQPLAALTETVQSVTQGNLEQSLPSGGWMEWNQLTDAFGAMLTHLQQELQLKDQQVVASAEELEERTRQIQAAAEVGRSAVSILNADELIQEVVGFIRSRFNLYYVGLFMVDESGEWAVLRAGTGEAGRIMQARGHRIRVGQGMIGWSVANQQARVAGEAGADAVRLATDELPETRAEAALPLTSRGRVIGALTVQSAQEGFFTESTVTVLQTMADQVAVALDNASLFAESQLALDALRRSYGEVSRKEWVEMMRARQVPGYTSDERGIYPVKEETARRRQSAKAGDIEIPVKVRDQILGTLKAAKPKGESGWTDEDVALLETLADQLSVALENARLYESTQRRAERERILADITAKVRASTDINVILQTAIQELADALRVSRGKIELHQAGIDGGDGGDSDD